MRWRGCGGGGRTDTRVGPGGHDEDGNDHGAHGVRALLPIESRQEGRQGDNVGKGVIAMI